MFSHIEFIYAVYQERSFSKAAHKLYVSQPWLSATVKKVEQELNAQIFNRSTSPISLTEAGQYYIEQIERILAIQQEVKDYFTELSASTAAHLRIGSSTIFCNHVLPTLLQEFREAYPQITLSFIDRRTSELLEGLKDGNLDFVLEAECYDSPLFRSEAFATEEIILAVPSEHPINQELSAYGYTFEEYLRRKEPNHKKPAVPLIKFAQEGFIMLTKDNDIYSRILSICKNASFSPQISFYVYQMITAYYLVCEGSGIAFLRSTIPEYVAPTDRVRFYQLDDPLAVRNIYLSRLRKKPSKIQQELFDYMMERRIIPEKR